MTGQLKAWWKRILSFTKKTWKIDDYPLIYRKQDTTAGEYTLGEVKEWIVQVINWWTMTGLGNSKKEAYENLKENYLCFLEDNIAPRPGKRVPLKHAETTQIEQLEDIAPDFFEKILKMNYFNCFISDQSSLFDFGKDENEVLKKINSCYKLGLTDLGDGNIVRLLKMIKKPENYQP